MIRSIDLYLLYLLYYFSFVLFIVFILLFYYHSLKDSVGDEDEDEQENCVAVTVITTLFGCRCC